MASKEEKVLELFYNESSKHWHFEQVLNAAKVSRSNASKWLAKLIKEGLITHFIPKGKMPYYRGNVDSPAYQTRKKIYALNKLQESGFLNHLATLSGAKTIFLFGSFSRWDWYKESDIDLFIYGDDNALDVATYETKLKREIQVFTANDKNDLRLFSYGLIKNIINGYRIKGRIEDIIQVN
ncbi:nucleotidyltransferase domain-containing protein [Candidatus Woesearchaeota archaeon]|nr:nucleotidyltransferase domain-containing protein [Candidatus Woesearchaeota archaeon]